MKTSTRYLTRHVLTVVLAFTGMIESCAMQPMAPHPWPISDWEPASSEEVDMDMALLEQARDYALTGGGSGVIIRYGRQVFSWGDQEQRYDLKSTTKSFGVTALGIALLDGRVTIEDPVSTCHPTFGVPPEENAATGWLEQITLLHLVTHTSGFGYPGGYEPLLFEPGTRFLYSDSAVNWLAECLTLVYKRDMMELMFERIFTPIGISREDLSWRTNQYRPAEIEGVPRREFASGIHANVNAMARLGYLYLRQGYWEEEMLLQPGFVAMTTYTDPDRAAIAPYDEDTQPGEDATQERPTGHYGMLWWTNSDSTLEKVPPDAYWAWGLYESLIIVIPSLDLVIARAGQAWQRTEDMSHYDILRPFLEPIVAASKPASDDDQPAIRAPFPAPAVSRKPPDGR